MPLCIPVIRQRLNIFSLKFQDTLVKVKGVLCDEKRHIRFSDWSAHDVNTIPILFT